MASATVTSATIFVKYYSFKIKYSLHNNCIHGHAALPTSHIKIEEQWNNCDTYQQLSTLSVLRINEYEFISRYILIPNNILDHLFTVTPYTSAMRHE
jgi:hypothetical protein